MDLFNRDTEARDIPSEVLQIAPRAIAQTAQPFDEDSLYESIACTYDFTSFWHETATVWSWTVAGARMLNLSDCVVKILIPELVTGLKHTNHATVCGLENLLDGMNDICRPFSTARGFKLSLRRKGKKDSTNTSIVHAEKWHKECD